MKTFFTATIASVALAGIAAAGTVNFSNFGSTWEIQASGTPINGGSFPLEQRESLISLMQPQHKLLSLLTLQHLVLPLILVVLLLLILTVSSPVLHKAMVEPQHSTEKHYHCWWRWS